MLMVIRLTIGWLRECERWDTWRGSTKEKRNIEIYIDRTVGLIDRHTEKILSTYDSISNIDDDKKKYCNNNNPYQSQWKKN